MGEPLGPGLSPAGTLSAPIIRGSIWAEYLDIHCGGIDNAFPPPHQRNRPV